MSPTRSYFRSLTKEGARYHLRRYFLMAAAIDLVNWSKVNRIDHIHGHSCADSAHVLAIAHGMGGPPYSLTLHGDLAVYGRDHRAKMRAAKFVCAVGTHLRHQILANTDLSHDQVFVTCMGVKTVELANLGRERVFGSGALHLVTVARLNPAKGHTHALAAIDSCVKSGLDLTYTIAGEGPHREFILSRINELGLNGRVRVTGALSETEILQLLSAADVFILPSIGLGEAWPVSVMEAMGAALPVIASDIGATPEMIVSGEDGILVPQADEHAISQAITLLARDVGARQRMGYAARQTATRRFDVAVTANVLLRAIQSGSELSCT